MKRFMMFAMVLSVSNGDWAGAQTNRPILVLDAGGHTDSMPKVLFTSDGKKLVTISKDKSIRIWDIASGTVERTLRPPIAAGRAGTLYAADLSRDGLLAVAGIGVRPGESPIYLIDLATARIERRLLGHTGIVTTVVFTPDGKHLLSGSEQSPGRIWSVATGECLHVLENPLTTVVRAAASPDSQKIATGSRDGYVRVWSVATGQCDASMRELVNNRYFGIWSLAWSKDGKFIAAGSHDWRVRLWNPDGKLQKDYGNFGDAIWGLAFSPDSQKLLVTRGTDKRTDCSIIERDTGRELANFKGHRAFAWDGAFSPDGKQVVTAGFLGEELLLWSPEDGKLIQRLGSKGQTVWATGWSADGTAIAWGNAGGRGDLDQIHPLERTFLTRDLEFGEAPRKGFSQARERSGAWTVERGTKYGSVAVKKDNAQVSELFVQGEHIGSFSLLPDKNQVITGTQYSVYLFDAETGKQLRRFQGNSGNPLAVAPSPDGRFVLAGFADQTLRIWSVDRPDPLLSFFFSQEEWIAWTPEGYYAASPGGEALMGWAIDNGPDKLASFYPAAHFHKSLYRPDVIKLLLEAGSVEKALELANKAKNNESAATKVDDVLPPLVVITSPDQTPTSVADGQLTVRAVAKSTGKHPIVSLRLMLNGRPHADLNSLKKFDPPKLGEVRESWTVKLPPGKHQVAVMAESAVSKSISEPVEVNVEAARGVVREDEKPKKDKNLPNLYVLAIGVSEYPGDLKLKYAAKDAKVLAKTLEATSRNLYQNVEVKLLTDKEATRKNILQGFTWLKKSMTQHDVAIVTFAGHGEKDSDGRLYLLPVDVDRDDLVSSAVPSDQIKNLLSTTPGRIIMMLDACHSGAVDGGERRRAAGGLTDDLVRDLVSDDYGVVVMCSSTGKEFSLESSDVEHGFFTLAMVEGLSGRADFDNSGAVYLNELDTYVSKRVKELSKGRQHPVTTRPTSIRSFPLSRPQQQSSLRQTPFGPNYCLLPPKAQALARDR